LAKCPYCDFVSYVDAAADEEAYTEAVLREVRARAPLLGERRIGSVFFGGGTPSLWAPARLGRVLKAVLDAGAGVGGGSAAGSAPGASAPVEVTVECNPTSLDEDKARALVDVGVNRLSVGVQSLDTERLRFLGRLHDARGGIRAVEAAVRAGVPRVSADVIFGVAGQTPAEATSEALRLVGLGLSHVSVDQLTIESGTRFGELARRGRLPLADDGAQAETFLALDAALSAAGLGHYEISNYARPGEEARHNLGYWRGDDYVGLGCAAYGFVRSDGPGGDVRRGHGTRWRNAPRPERYIGAHPSDLGSNGMGTDEPPEQLDAETLLRERIMLGLRVAEGVDVEAAAQALGTEGWTPRREREAARLEAQGRLVRAGTVARIPPSAWLWADDTAARLF
jgi:oxygen-independent coproporphyrinogen-3 oxidase